MLGKQLTKKRIDEILTTKLLDRWNHLRQRANVEPLTMKDAKILMQAWTEEQAKDHFSGRLS